MARSGLRPGHARSIGSACTDWTSLCRKLSAKLFDPRALTRESSANRFGPVIFSKPEVIQTGNAIGTAFVGPILERMTSNFAVCPSTVNDCSQPRPDRRLATTQDLPVCAHARMRILLGETVRLRPPATGPLCQAYLQRKVRLSSRLRVYICRKKGPFISAE